MNVVTFCELDESLFKGEHKVEHFNSGCSGDAQIAIIDIESIFEFEENKSSACADKYVSIAIIEDESDYEAFKNFGIDAWIRQADISQINNIISLVNNRILS